MLSIQKYLTLKVDYKHGANLAPVDFEAITEFEKSPKNKQWAEYIKERWNGTKLTETNSNVSEVYAIVAFPIADFEALNKMAEE